MYPSVNPQPGFVPPQGGMPMPQQTMNMHQNQMPPPSYDGIGQTMQPPIMQQPSMKLHFI